MTSNTNVNVILMDFKSTKSNELVVLNEDDTYTIFINARLSADGQYRAYQHAMKHIENEDFQKDNVQAIEAVAHSDQSKQIKTSSMSAEEYLERLARIRREQKRIKKKIQEDEERVRFLAEHGDAFVVAERQFLYGNDL